MKHYVRVAFIMSVAIMALTIVFASAFGVKAMFMLQVQFGLLIALLISAVISHLCLLWLETTESILIPSKIEKSRNSFHKKKR